MDPKAALLVIDMQVIFKRVAYYPSLADTVIPNIKSLISAARANGLKLIFTQHGHDASAFLPLPSFTVLTNQIVRKYGYDKSIHIGTPDWELMDEIAENIKVEQKGSTGREGNEGGGDLILAKDTYDAFVNTRLEELLVKERIGKVVICGVLTNACVESTARAAFNRGFETWIVRDACSAAMKHMHQSPLEVFSYAYNEAVSTKKMVEEIEGGIKGYLQGGSEDS